MKNWGSYIVTMIGYGLIGYIMGTHYHLDAWDTFTLVFWITVIQSLIKFINEIVEY